MFYTKNELNESIMRIVTDDVDNDIIFVTGNRGIGKTKLLKDLHYLIIPEDDAIVADGQSLTCNCSSIAKGFIEGIIIYLEKHNSYNNKKLVCDRIDSLSAYQSIKASASLSFFKQKCPRHLSKMSLEELKEIYISLAQRTPLIIISSSMKLSEVEKEYLRMLCNDPFKARVTFIIGISSNPDNHKVVSDILESNRERVYILPLSALILKESDEDDPYSLASMEIHNISGASVCVDSDSLWTTSMNSEMYNLVADLVNQDLNPKLLPVLAMQDVSSSSYECVQQITNEIYGAPTEEPNETLVLQADGQMLWLDVMSYYMFMNNGMDKAIEATQVFFHNVINLMLNPDEERRIKFAKLNRKAFPAFVNEVKQNRQRNTIATGFEQYYSDYAVLANIIFMRETNNASFPEVSHKSVAIIERLVTDFNPTNIGVIEQVYDSAQIISVLDIGLQIVTDYILFHRKNDSEQVYKEANHFINVCISAMIKWNDMTLLNELVSLLETGYKNEIPLINASDRRIIGFNQTMESTLKKKLIDKGIVLEEGIVKNSVRDSLAAYWYEKGEDCLEEFKNEPYPPKPKKVFKPDELNDRLSECESILLTANPLEDRIITNCLVDRCGDYCKINSDIYTYDFFEWNNHKIAHLVPDRTSSFTDGGSADAVQHAIDHMNKDHLIRGVFAVGVAYGGNYAVQNIGDVLISKEIMSWDCFFKVTNGAITFNKKDLHDFGTKISAGVKRFIIHPDYPKKNLNCTYNWYFGTMLEGAAVLSDEPFKELLIRGAEIIGVKEIIGGEMEGSGIRFSTRKPDIPAIIIKGICDWGALKNDWDFIETDNKKQKKIKDSIQAYACKNAFDSYIFFLDNVFGS